MRTKIRNALEIKPGMVIRLEYSSQPFREVATITPGPWPNTRTITFTDGGGEWYGRSTHFQVARGKTARRLPQARLVLASRGFADAAFALVGAYLAAARRRCPTIQPLNILAARRARRAERRDARAMAEVREIVDTDAWLAQLIDPNRDLRAAEERS